MTSGDAKEEHNLPYGNTLILPTLQEVSTPDAVSDLAASPTHSKISFNRRNFSSNSSYPFTDATNYNR